jgi:hypothetical protein
LRYRLSGKKHEESHFSTQSKGKNADFGASRALTFQSIETAGLL